MDLHLCKKCPASNSARQGNAVSISCLRKLRPDKAEKGWFSSKPKAEMGNPQRRTFLSLPCCLKTCFPPRAHFTDPSDTVPVAEPLQQFLAQCVSRWERLRGHMWGRAPGRSCPPWAGGHLRPLWRAVLIKLVIQLSGVLDWDRGAVGWRPGWEKVESTTGKSFICDGRVLTSPHHLL